MDKYNPDCRSIIHSYVPVVQNAPTSLLNAKKKSVQEELNIIADQLALEYAIDPHPTITPPASLCLHHLMPYIFFMMDL